MLEKPVVIVGGGIAGLAVAKILNDDGVPCTIVEREPALGGHVGQWACMATDRCQRCFSCLVEDLIQDVRRSEEIEVLTGWEPASLESLSGDGKKIGLKQVGTDAELHLEPAALVFATGFEPYNPSEKALWGHGRMAGVFTLAELDAMIRGDALSAFTRGVDGLNVAFFQCVGSRDMSSGANYCSQYCCKSALRMALKLNHEHAGTAVTLYYIDLQLAGKYGGELLKQAADKNIRLCQGVPGEIVEGPEGKLEVIVEREGKNVRESFDRVVLAIGQRPSRSLSLWAEQGGLPLGEFGFAATRTASDTSRTPVPGVYVAGTCSGPKDIEQTLAHAGQTAATLIADIHQGRLR